MRMKSTFFGIWAFVLNMSLRWGAWFIFFRSFSHPSTNRWRRMRQSQIGPRRPLWKAALNTQFPFMSRNSFAVHWTREEWERLTFEKHGMSSCTHDGRNQGWPCCGSERCYSSLKWKSSDCGQIFWLDSLEREKKEIQVMHFGSTPRSLPALRIIRKTTWVMWTHQLLEYHGFIHLKRIRNPQKYSIIDTSEVQMDTGTNGILLLGSLWIIVVQSTWTIRVSKYHVAFKLSHI